MLRYAFKIWVEVTTKFLNLYSHIQNITLNFFRRRTSFKKPNNSWKREKSVTWSLQRSNKCRLPFFVHFWNIRRQLIIFVSKKIICTCGVYLCYQSFTVIVFLSVYSLCGSECNGQDNMFRSSSVAGTLIFVKTSSLGNVATKHGGNNCCFSWNNSFWGIIFLFVV